MAGRIQTQQGYRKRYPYRRCGVHDDQHTGQQNREKRKNKLAHLTDIIGEKIIGQKEAVEKVVKAIQRNRAGLKDPDRPVGSFIFLDKPELVKHNWPKSWPKKFSTPKKTLFVLT